MSKSDLMQLDKNSLCSAYRAFGTERLKTVIIERQLMTHLDWNAIKEEKLYEGMAECALRIGFGEKNYCRSTHSLIENNVTHTIYRCTFPAPLRMVPAKKIDVEVINDKVTKFVEPGVTDKLLEDIAIVFLLYILMLPLLY
jgi:hypothetical protein